MNSNQVFAVIEQIAATSSKNEKQALVNANVGNPVFVRVLEYAYNPFKRFGMRILPAVTANPNGEVFDGATWEMLDDMAAGKLTGDAAKMAVTDEFCRLSPESADLLGRIIRKDLRAGFSEATINKACKGLIPEFPYMRCSLPKNVKLQDWDWANGIISQEKADGMFTNVTSDVGKETQLSTRQGTPLPSSPFADIIEIIDRCLPAGYQRHGELLVEREGVILSRKEGNGILNSVAQGGKFGPLERPVLKLWDSVEIAAIKPKGRTETPYATRLLSIARPIKLLPKDAPVRIIDTRIVFSLEEAYRHFSELLHQGKEGTIIKKKTAIWYDSGSAGSPEQVKLKLEVPVELVITGVVPGKVGTKNEGRAGSLTCESSDGKLVVDVTVKNDKMRDSVDAEPEAWIGGIMTVISNEIMEPGPSNEKHSLFLPRFAEDQLRTDKSTADSLDRIYEQFDNAIKGVADLVGEAA